MAAGLWRHFCRTLCFFRLLSGIGSAIIHLVFGRGGRRGLLSVELTGNDIVRELMGIA